MRLDFRLPRTAVRVVLAIGAASAALAVAPRRLHAQDATAARTSADSSFTDAQAERGAKVFTRVCLECHAREDMRNPDFKGKWGGQTTFDLFKSISTTMPDNNPGILAITEYVDVVAYILKLNGVPSGTTELAADTTAMQAAKLALPASASGGLVQRLRALEAGGARPWLAYAHTPRTATRGRERR